MTLLIASLLAIGAAQPQDFLVEDADDLLEFRYGWPAAVEEEPALRAALQAEMQRARIEARENAAADHAARSPQFPFIPHSYEKAWEVMGSSERLLSLDAGTYSFSGGAHGNLALEALLWDRTGDQAVEPAALLGDAALARLAPRFCDALDAMRAERRGEPIRRDPFDNFTACPALAEQELAAVDEDGDGRFDGLHVLIPPYAAGPWVEGPYVVELALTAGDLAGIAAEYRMGFEPVE